MAPRFALIMVLAGQAIAPLMAEVPVLAPGASVPLVVRWAVEDGYYIDSQPPSSVTFKAPEGVRVVPGRVETSGRVVGGAEQDAQVRIASDATPGRSDIRAALEIYFCSVAEKWCKRITRTAMVPLAVAAPGGGSPVDEALQFEIVVPLDDER